MKVLHVSVFDSRGGAARAAERLHRGLLEADVESDMLVLSRSTRDPSVRSFVPPMDLRRRLTRGIKRRMLGKKAGWFHTPTSYELFSTDLSQHGGDLATQLGSVDVVHLHWVASLFDYRAFFKAVPPRVPVVWTLHDMNPFTGGCHYDGSCGRFQSSCGACPQLGSNSDHDLSRDVWKRKKQAFEAVAAGRLAIATPSRWLANECRQSSLMGRFEVEVIPYGLDLELFCPRSRRDARNLFDIPDNAFVVLCVAESLTQPRKGFRYVLEAVPALRDIPNLYLLAIGAGDAELPSGVSGRVLSSVSDDRMLSFIYSAADVFVIPSVQDNFPNTVIESLACGTPVVGFDVGGIRDMVRPNKTGLLVKPEDAAALANAIRQLSANSSLCSHLATNARHTAESEYGSVQQARRYVDLYGRICGDLGDASGVNGLAASCHG